MTNVTLTRKRELIWVSPDSIVANDNNPRSERAFTPDELVSLRRSIMTHGVLEPVIISPYKGDTYKLIEGERRWRSARSRGSQGNPGDRRGPDERLRRAGGDVQRPLAAPWLGDG